MTWIIAGAIVVRVAVMVPGLSRLDDPDRYLTLARSLAEGRGFALGDRPTAYRPPLYPILLSPIVAVLPRAAWPWGVGGLHLALGVGTVGLTYAAGRLGKLSTRRSALAAAVVAFDPVLVVQSRSLMTETPAALLVAATLAAAAIPRISGAIVTGGMFGLASLCRPSLLPAACLAALASLAVGPEFLRERLTRTAWLVLATGLTLAPWAIRNAVVIGEPVWTTTHGGYTLALANNPVYYAEVLDGPVDAVWSGPNQTAWFARVGRITDGLSEPEADRVLRAEAVQFIRDRPRDFARAAVARLGRFWGVAPSSSVYSGRLRVVTALWTTPVWIALVIGMMNRRNWSWPGIVAPGFLVALTVIHLAYWTDLRMRAPLVPAIALVAATAGFRWFGESRPEARSDQ